MRHPTGHPPAVVQVRALSMQLPLRAAIIAIALRRAPAILESGASHPGQGRFSILVCDPVEVLEVPPPRSPTPEGWGALDPFGTIEEAIARTPAVTEDAGLPFCGGWIGFLAYDAGLALEGIAPRTPAATSFPWIRLGLYDTIAVFDHHRHLWRLAAVEWPAAYAVARSSADERLDKLTELLREAAYPQSQEPPAHVATVNSDDHREVPQPRPDWTWPQYAGKVAAALEYIAAGHIYQVNLTQRFTASTSASPLDLYLSLRRENPADYAALISWDAGAVISSSPELFVELHAGRVRTRPIKGTRPRSGDPARDRIQRDALAASLKEQAELNMIIDLMRNDLGKVCAVGSVSVDSAGDIEAHPTVFHRVAEISGMLRPDCGPVDLLRAAFPAGSVTGAPKIRAMHIINELETVQRGVYCGAIGYLGLDGNACFNVAIRTMVLERGRVHLSAGGAIVADSDAEQEHQELLAKAEGMFRALRVLASEEWRMENGK